MFVFFWNFRHQQNSIVNRSIEKWKCMFFVFLLFFIFSVFVEFAENIWIRILNFLFELTSFYRHLLSFKMSIYDLCLCVLCILVVVMCIYLKNILRIWTIWYPHIWIVCLSLFCSYLSSSLKITVVFVNIMCLGHDHMSKTRNQWSRECNQRPHRPQIEGESVLWTWHPCMCLSFCISSLLILFLVLRNFAN